nr:uncharacterized mitochondrial protein AtMg00810-like [Tanacetum cinerariifolium]
RYLRGTVNIGLWYTKDSGFELTGFSDADNVGCKDTFKSTFGGAQFLGEKLEYSIRLLCPSPLDADTVNGLWLSLQQDFDLLTDYQLADLFTKALLADRFSYLVRRLGMHSLSPQELERLARSQ